MTDSKLLREKIYLSGYRLRFVAEKCSLSYQGLQNKIDNVSVFTAPEIVALRDLLKLTDDDVNAIFFAADVAKAAT